MKLLISLFILSASLNSWAFFDFFKKKVDPNSLTTFQERMDYLLENDSAFKKAWNERKDDLSDVEEANLKELKRIEDEIADSGKYTEDYIKQRKEQNEAKAKADLEQKIKSMEAQLMTEWAIVDGEFVNLKDHNEKQVKKRAEQEELRRIQQFQSEEGIPVSRKMEDIRINVD